MCQTQKDDGVLQLVLVAYSVFVHGFGAGVIEYAVAFALPESHICLHLFVFLWRNAAIDLFIGLAGVVVFAYLKFLVCTLQARLDTARREHSRQEHRRQNCYVFSRIIHFTPQKYKKKMIYANFLAQKKQNTPKKGHLVIGCRFLALGSRKINVKR